MIVMKFLFALIILFSLLSFNSVYAGETSVKVNIKQEGEGTSSSVRVNGEEWKLEGPGEINVDKTSLGTAKPVPLNSATVEQSSLPTQTPSPESQISALNQFFEMLEEIKSTITNFLFQIF